MASYILLCFLSIEQDDCGWKMINGDVFRFPKHRSLLCSILGNNISCCHASFFRMIQLTLLVKKISYFINRFDDCLIDLFINWFKNLITSNYLFVGLMIKWLCEIECLINLSFFKEMDVNSWLLLLESSRWCCWDFSMFTGWYFHLG